MFCVTTRLNSAGARVLEQGGGTWQAHGARAYNEGLGAWPPAGSGEDPLKLKAF